MGGYRGEGQNGEEDEDTVDYKEGSSFAKHIMAQKVREWVRE